jgi:hypothetical protein
MCVAPEPQRVERLLTASCRGPFVQSTLRFASNNLLGRLRSSSRTRVESLPAQTVSLLTLWKDERAQQDVAERRNTSTSLSPESGKNLASHECLLPWARVRNGARLIGR